MEEAQGLVRGERCNRMMSDKAIQVNMADYPCVGVNEPLTRALGLMFRHKCDVLPVTDGGSFVGMLKESSLSGALSAGAAEGMRVWEMTDLAVPRLGEEMGLEEVLKVIRSHPQETMLPIVSKEGMLKGMVRLRDVMAHAMEVARPPRVGGMATPFGVYLHCGSAGAGSNSGQLMLTGVFLALMVGVAWVLSFLLSWLIEGPIGVPLVPILLGSPVLVGGAGMQAFPLLIWLLPVVIFLILLKFSRLSQFHAAEHMVVHTLEHFEPLTEEVVGRMNRVHPRCGSNLMVPLLLLYTAGVLWALPSKWYSIALFVLVLATGRNLGAVAQAWFTTRPPERRHIEKAIQAAKDLVENYLWTGRKGVPVWLRVWNMGILQVLIGAGLAYGAYYFLLALAQSAI